MRGGNGANENSILDYTIHAASADRILQLDKDGVPTGKILNTKGTRFDITSPVTLKSTGSIDNYFIFGGSRKVIVEASNAPTLVVESDHPGFQVYTPDGFGSVAIEPSGYVDAPNNPNFPSIVVKPGCTTKSTMRFRFE